MALSEPSTPTAIETSTESTTESTESKLGSTESSTGSTESSTGSKETSTGSTGSSPDIATITSQVKTGRIWILVLGSFHRLKKIVL